MSKSISESVLGASNYRLSRTCIRYIGMKDIRHSLRNLDDLEIDEIVRGFPLMKYAITSWTLHAESAEKEMIAQDDLSFFLHQPSNHILKF